MNNRELDSHFVLNKESYEKDFLPVYEKLGIRPKFLIQFPILLPFEIPFSAGCVSIELEDRQACTFHFSGVHTNSNIFTGIVGPDPLSVPICQTRVEMSYASDREGIIPPDNIFLSEIFDRMVRYLNSIIMAYLVYKKDVDVYQVSREMFECGCIVRVIPVDDWDNTWAGLFLNSTNTFSKKERLRPEEFHKIVRYAGEMHGKLNPFILSEKLMLNAMHNFKHGFYQEAVVHCQSSMETFLTALLSKLMEYEGKNEAERHKILAETPLIDMVKKEFQTRLGGAWNPDDSFSAIGRWYLNTYSLKNNVVQQGLAPTDEEVSAALSAAGDFKAEIIKLICERKEAYPGLAMLIPS